MRVRYPAYRRYKASLITANDAMMALMIGARLGEHALANSPASVDARLPELFGGIPGIKRVNRTVGDAAILLADSEAYLASMGIPYVLGVHGVLLADSIQMLREDGQDSESDEDRSIPWSTDPNQIPLSTVHEYFSERAKKPLDPSLVCLFHIARKIRNRIMHFGGTAGSSLLSEYRQMPKDLRDRWERITGRPVQTAKNDQLLVADGELIAVLAFTRALGRAVSDCLAETLSREFWIRTIEADYRSSFPQRYGEADQRSRRLTGFAGTHYAQFGLTQEDFS